ncbi:hypothetical protein T484DRAFT_1761549 [Baffinella frigidus]|nr:hypothetical protein T484DRAFT_1761549 [Cryptophyta sp. CCMP2293]
MSGGGAVSDVEMDKTGWVGASWAPGRQTAAGRGVDEEFEEFDMVRRDGQEEVYAFGFFIELGANDGVAQSNTLRLEELLGWRGLHIEGDLGTHARLRAGGEVTWLTGSSPLTNGIASTMPNEILGLSHGDFDLSDPGTDSAEEVTPAKCEPLSHILASLGRTTRASRFKNGRKKLSTSSTFEALCVDLWVLDVEGAELEVLESVDFSAVTINVVCAEALYFDELRWEERHRKVREKLESVGFRYDGYEREMSAPVPPDEAVRLPLDDGGEQVKSAEDMNPSMMVAVSGACASSCSKNCSNRVQGSVANNNTLCPTAAT